MLLTDEEIIDLFPDTDDGDGDIQYGRAIESAVLAKLREQEPVGYFHPEYMGGPVLYFPVNYSNKDEEGVVPLFEHPAPIPEVVALKSEIESLRISYDAACMLVAQMHEAAMGEVVGPKLGVVEDVAAMKAEHDKYKALCDQLGWAAEKVNALSIQSSAHIELREALTAWRNNK